ncbi:MAG: HAD family hydrolase [bacterium]|nr:HAD family hydrolase [bacterium]
MSEFIFLDRDGTIIKDKPYMSNPKEIEFLPKAIIGLQKLRDAGYKFIIVSNQAGIARSFYSKNDAKKFNNKLVAKLNSHGIKIEKIYICPHHPDFTGLCICRKPNTGMAETAASEFRIKLNKALYIGDKDCDIQLGKNCGGKTFLIDNDQYETSVEPNYKVKNILEASEIIVTTSL